MKIKSKLDTLILEGNELKVEDNFKNYLALIELDRFSKADIQKFIDGMQVYHNNRKD